MIWAEEDALGMYDHDGLGLHRDLVTGNGLHIALESLGSWLPSPLFLFASFLLQLWGPPDVDSVISKDFFFALPESALAYS
jgi:hypothetical protein